LAVGAQGVITAGTEAVVAEVNHAAAQEGGPRIAIGLDAAHRIRRRHVEDDDVVGVIGEDAIEVASSNRCRPPLDELPDL
jgi:hypothetical protein